MPHERTKIFKIVILKCHLLLFYAAIINHVSIWLWHAMKSGFYTTTGDDHLSSWTEKKLQNTSQSQTCTQKRSWSLFGGLLLVWFTAAFWILAKPLQLRSKAQQINEMHQKLQCLKLAMINRKGSIFLHGSAQPHITQSTVQTFNKLGYEVLPHLPYSPNLSPTDYHFFKHLNDFLQGKCLHNQQEAENAVQESTECWSTYFYVTGINVFISHWQECVDCSGFYFD